MASGDRGTDLKYEPGRVPDVARFEITVVRGEPAGAQVKLDETSPGRILVGSGAACDLRLEDHLVSRRHLALDVRGAGLRITDLDSTNGTQVSGIRIHDALLRGGEHVVVGETTLEVTRITTASSAAVPTSRGFGRLLGASLEMRRLYPLFDRLAASSLPLLLEGEPGTGKELLAETLHERGPRAVAPFVVLDCASAARIAFERVDGGTLVLDEVGELADEIQPVILRLLERGEVAPVGDEAPKKISVRVIGSTTADLDRAVQEGRFREDLFLRLATTKIELPPLRERSGDVGVLARHFWEQLGGDPSELPYEAFERFERSAWPGNVRELHTAVARLLTFGESRSPSEDGEAPPERLLERFCDLEVPYVRAKEELIRAFEREYVDAMWQRHGGNAHHAAAASGLALRYFQLLRAKHRAKA